jgi:hypothetical protein
MSRASRLDLRREWRLVAKDRNIATLARQRLIEKRGEFRQRPGDIADADAGIAGGAELAFHEFGAAIAGFRIAIAAADDAEAARRRHRRRRRAARHAAHRRQNDRMGDAEKPGDRG